MKDILGEWFCQIIALAFIVLIIAWIIQACDDVYHFSGPSCLKRCLEKGYPEYTELTSRECYCKTETKAVKI